MTRGPRPDTRPAFETGRPERIEIIREISEISEISGIRGCCCGGGGVGEGDGSEGGGEWVRGMEARTWEGEGGGWGQHREGGGGGAMGEEGPRASCEGSARRAHRRAPADSWAAIAAESPPQHLRQVWDRGSGGGGGEMARRAAAMGSPGALSAKNYCKIVFLLENARFVAAGKSTRRVCRRTAGHRASLPRVLCVIVRTGSMQQGELLA